MAALHLDATLRYFVQGNLSMDDYCRKMKSMADYLPTLAASSPTATSSSMFFRG
jgi:hypothetical protein